MGSGSDWHSLLGHDIAEQLIAQAYDDVANGRHNDCGAAIVNPSGMPRCQGEGCKRLALNGMSFCSYDHYEELVEERKAKNGYRTGSALGPKIDYSAQLKPATASTVHVAAPAPKPVSAPKLPKLKSKAQLSRETLSDERLKRLRALGMSYKQICDENGQEYSVIAERCQQLRIGSKPTAAPEKEMPVKAQEFEGLIGYYQPTKEEANGMVQEPAIGIQAPDFSGDHRSDGDIYALKYDFNPQAAVTTSNNPYDLVIADLEKRRDSLLDAIRLMHALRDSGV